MFRTVFELSWDRPELFATRYAIAKRPV